MPEMLQESFDLGFFKEKYNLDFSEAQQIARISSDKNLLNAIKALFSARRGDLAEICFSQNSVTNEEYLKNHGMVRGIMMIETDIENIGKEMESYEEDMNADQDYER